MPVVLWIVLGVLLFAVVILALAVRPVLVRLPRLRRAVLVLMRRQGELEALQRSAVALQERMLVLQRQAGTAQDRLAAVKAKRR